MADLPLLLTRIEVAKLLGVSPSTFSGWVAAGTMPGPLPGTKRWSRVQMERAAAGMPWTPEDDAKQSSDDAFEKWEREYLKRKGEER